MSQQRSGSSIAAFVNVKDRQSGEWDEYRREFEVLPRVGEHVEIDRNGMGIMTKVVMIAHANRPSENIEVYAVEVGPTSECIEQVTTANYPESLTTTERLILWNQHRALSKLYPDEAKHHEERCEILEQGYALFYPVQHIDPNEVKEDYCREVIQIMNMFRALHFSYEKLADRSGINKHRVGFEGFDGNEETALMAFVRFLVEDQEKFQELKGGTRDNFNSHMPRLDHYRRMRAEWESSREKYELTKEDIVRIVGV